MLVRFVNMFDDKIKIEEYFLNFLNVDDTSGSRLFSLFVDSMNPFGLDMDDVRGQGYDIGSNMNGKNKRGHSKAITCINLRVCTCHVLAIVLTSLFDMARSCSKVITF